MNVQTIAKQLHKDPSGVRAGIIEGWLPIGIATRNRHVVTSVHDIDSHKGRINYYIFENWKERLYGRSN